MHKLEVYDKKNPERLLGDIRVREFAGLRLRVPMMGRTTYRPYWEEAPDLELSYIELEKHWVVEAEHDGPFKRTRTERCVLLTDAPLSSLMAHREFKPSGVQHLIDRGIY